MRLVMESKYWKDICFVTLTYDDENLPYNIVDASLFLNEDELQEEESYGELYFPTLCPDHMRNFLKRLRKQLPFKIRYYGVGEYGSRRGRPHLHLMIFGLPFSQETDLLIRKCWKYGFTQVRPFFEETCSYIAGYVQKKLYGKEKFWYKLPEFMRCSQHLGEQWILDHLSEFDDEHPFINWHGFQYGIPRQFRKLLIKLGRLSETSLIGTALVQKAEYTTLLNNLRTAGIDEKDFWRNRINLAKHKEARKSTKRNLTGDI